MANVLIDRWVQTSHFPHNSKITYPREKSIIIKNIASKISDKFYLNIMYVRHRGNGEN